MPIAERSRGAVSDGAAAPRNRDRLGARIFVWVLLPAALAAAPWLSSTMHSARIAPPTARGDAFLANGQCAAAIEAYQDAIARSPNRAAPYLSLVAAYHQARYEAESAGRDENRRYFDAIIETYQAALAVRPGDVRIATGLALTQSSARVYGLAPDWAAAQQAWENCLALRRAALVESEHPDDRIALVTPLMNLARIAHAQEHRDEAAGFLREALRIAPDSPAAAGLLAQLR